MVSWPCVMNDRDIAMPAFPHQTDHLNSVRKQVIMAFYAGVEEVKNVEDIIKNGCKIMVLMRGLPGSGKSTLARCLMETLAETSTTKEKHVFSADDYFIDPKNNAYIFNRKYLREAHSWNVDAVCAAAQKNVTPIIVDNTNLTVSEMWPYACIAAKYDYIVRYLEPSTHWRYNIHECAKRNTHGVSENHIARMMGRFDRSVSESELLNLVSSKTNYQNYCDTHCNSRRVITRYRQQKLYAENSCMRQLLFICIYNEKIFKPFCRQSDSYLPNLPNVLLDSVNILRAVRTSRLPDAQQFVLTSLPSSSEFIKSLFYGRILSIHNLCNIRKQNQACKTVSLRNNVLSYYENTFKCLPFLHLIVSVRNVGICAAEFTSMKEMFDKRPSLDKYSPPATHQSLGRYGCISRGNKLRMILAVEHCIEPSVNINNVKRVVFPNNVRSLFLPAQKNIWGGKICVEADNGNKKRKASQIFYTETAAKCPSLEKVSNVQGRSTYQANSGDLKHAKSIPWSRDVCDSSDSWNVCASGNNDPWDVSDSDGSTSWDMCGNVSWETETLTQSIIPNESGCVLPKPQRTHRKASIARHSSEQNPANIERRSRPTEATTEEEMNCSLPKPRRTNKRPRTTQYSRDEYAPKLEPKITLSPELEAWNSVEDPLSSWERKQNIESGHETVARELHKSQNTSQVSTNVSVINQTVPSVSAEEEEHLTSKPQREKRIRNRQ